MTDAPAPLRAAPRRPASTLWSIVILWVVFYASFTLFVPPLLDDADSVHAEVAREMLLRHDWVTLYANGIRYLEKAPLLYWSMAVGMKVFGACAAAARLPLAFAVLALTLAVEAFARRAFGGAQAGLYAALMVLSSFGIFIFSHITLPDVVVCLWLTLAMLCLWLNEMRSRPSRLLCCGFAACCALNVLTKGLIGVVFPVGIAVVYLLLVYGPRSLLARVGRYHLLSSSLLFVAIALPWHILIGLANPAQGQPGGLHWANGHWTVPLPTEGNVHGWFWFYFVNEQVLRYLNLRVPRDYDTVPLGLFYGLTFVWLMPFSAFLPAALSPRAIPWGRLLRSGSVAPEERGRVLFVVWAGIVLLFFSFSTRQEYYVLPALPALVLLIAGWLGGEAGQPVERALGRGISGAVAIVGGVLAAVALFFVVRGRPLAPGQDLAMLLSQNPGEYALSFGHFLDLSTASMGVFRVPLLLSAIAFSGGPVAAWWLRGRGKTHRANLALFAATFLFLLAAHLGLQTFASVLSSRQLADAIAPQLRDEDLIVLNGEYEAGSTLGFYLRRRVNILNGRSSNLWYGSFFPDAPAIFETDGSLAGRWRGAQRIFLWQDLSSVDGGGDGNRLPVLAGPIYVIARGGGKEILSNQPNH